MSIAAVPLLAPFIFALTAALAIARPGLRPGHLPRLAELAALGAFAVAIMSGIMLALAGPTTVSLAAFVVSIRLDLVSVAMLALVTFIGWVVDLAARMFDRYPDSGDRKSVV